MKGKRMTITLTPRSMDELAGWDFFLSGYLADAMSGDGDFQIRMDYQKGDGLTMQLIKEGRLVRRTHVKRGLLAVVKKITRPASGFILAARRRKEPPSILLEQDAGASKDSISVAGEEMASREGGTSCENK